MWKLINRAVGFQRRNSLLWLSEKELSLSTQISASTNTKLAKAKRVGGKL
jgi:hypothetical protein